MATVFAGFGQAQTEAERLIQAGHWKRARVMVERRYQADPNDALANYLLSQIRYAFGDHAAPLALAERAVTLNSGVAKYHRQVAEVLGVEAEHAGPFRQFLLARRFRKEIDTAIALDGQDLQALRDLMEFYLLAPGIAGGDFQKARAMAERIRGIDAAEGYLAQARLAAFRKHPAQEALLRQAAHAQPPSYRARMELARFELGGGHRNLDVAEAAAKEAIQMDRNRVEGYAILAAVYATREDAGALDTALSEAIRQVPDDLAPYYRAAEVLVKNNRDAPRAQEYLRKYLSQEPEGNEPPAAEARRLLAIAGTGRDQSHSGLEADAPQ